MRRLLFSFLALMVALSVFAVSCGSSSSSSTTAGGVSSSTTVGASSSTTGATTGTTQGSGAGGAQVTIQNFAFAPASVTIKVGESVTWTNQDSPNHTVVADKGEFTSDSLATGATFSFTFSKAGTYAYHCSIHPTMKGTVVVQ